MQVFAFGQAPAIEWQKCLGGSGYENALSAQQTTDGGYIVVGSTSGSNNGDVTGNHGFYDGWLVKLSGAGALEWQKTLGGVFDDVANVVQQTTDGGYIVVGTTTSSNLNISGNNGDGDVLVIKLTAAGIIQWQQAYGGSSNENGESIELTSDGGYIVAGRTSSNNGNVSGNHGGEDGWVIKLSSTGVMEWQKAFGGSDNDSFTKVKQTTDGGYIIAGHAQSNDGDIITNLGISDYWVLKISAMGLIEWSKMLGGSNYDWANDVQQTNEGGYIVAGYTLSNDGDVTGNHGIFDAWIVKLTAAGNIGWQKTIGGTDMDYAFRIKQTLDNGYITVGYTASSNGNFSTNNGDFDFFAVKISNSGIIQWQKTMGGTNADNGQSVSQTTDGGFILAGSSLSNNGDVFGNHGYRDFWVTKLSSDPLFTTMFENYKLIISPNPANQFLNLKTSQRIEAIIISDISGKIVFNQNNNLETIDVSKLAKGIYFLNANIEGKTVVEKFIKE